MKKRCLDLWLLCIQTGLLISNTCKFTFLYNQQMLWISCTFSANKLFFTAPTATALRNLFSLSNLPTSCPLDPTPSSGITPTLLPEWTPQGRSSWTQPRIWSLVNQKSWGQLLKKRGRPCISGVRCSSCVKTCPEVVLQTESCHNSLRKFIYFWANANRTMSSRDCRYWKHIVRHDYM